MPDSATCSCIATQAATDRLAQLYEQFTPAHLLGLGQYYAHDAYFKDPFNDVQGVPAITRVFEHMFATLDEPRFVVTQRLVQGDQAFLVWEFRFRFRRWSPGVEQCIHGTTHARFDVQGRVVLHRDYWDTAEELYQKIPVLGALMRWLQKAGAGSARPSRANPSRTDNSRS